MFSAKAKINKKAYLIHGNRKITLIGSSEKPAFLGLSSRRDLKSCLASFSGSFGEASKNVKWIRIVKLSGIG